MSRIEIRHRGAAYGHDCGPEGLFVVRASRGRKAIRYEILVDPRSPAAAESGVPVSIPAGEDIGASVTVAGLPASLGFARWLQTPFTSRGKARRVLPSLLDIQLPFPLEQCVYAFPESGTDAEGRTRALAVAARIADVESRLDELRERGVDPHLLDHEGLACWALAGSENPEPHDGVRAILHLGPDRCMLVLGVGGRLRSIHAFRSGVADFFGEREADPEPRHLPGLDAWIDRVRHVLRSQCPELGEGVHWIWTGPGAEQASRVAVLQERLELPAGVRFSVAEDPAAWLARALAFRGLDPRSEHWNLRNGTLEHPAREDFRDRAKTRVAVVAVAAGLVLVACNVAWRAELRVRNDRAQRQVIAAAAKVMGLSPSSIPRGQEVFLARQRQAGGSDASDPFTRAFESGVVRVIDLCVRHADRLRLGLTSLTATDPSFTVRGVASDWADCTAFANALRDQGYVVDVRRESPAASGTIAFVLSGRRPDA